MSFITRIFTGMAAFGSSGAGAMAGLSGPVTLQPGNSPILSVRSCLHDSPPYQGKGLPDLCPGEIHH